MKSTNPSMKGTNQAEKVRFRVWIAGYDSRQPDGYRDAPATATALEPAEDGTMSAEQAAVYVEAFNRAAGGKGRGIRAVALPVTLRYEGEPRPGQELQI